MKLRQIQPELLDSLPQDDPGAVRSRADLRLINHLMGNYSWIERQLCQIASTTSSPLSVVEIGAGCGTLAKRLHQRWPRIAYTGIDLAPRPSDLPPSFHWHQQDLLTSSLPNTDLVIANLCLHHFDADQLHAVGDRLGRCCQHLIINEPARRPIHLFQGKLLNLAGIHPITRHDMAISIRAGFLGRELAHDLRLDETAWTLDIQTTWLGAYRMTATRKVAA